MILRDYQFQCVDAIRDAFRAGYRRPLLVSPTGSGKTVIFKYIAENAAMRGKRVCILVHRKELLMQASAKLDHRHGLIKAGITTNLSDPIQIASVQTLVRRLRKAHYARPEFGFDLIIIDEAHHTVASTYMQILAAHPRALVLGVTATPCRADGKGLGDVFDTLIQGPTVQELVDLGWLVPSEVYAPSVLDVSQVHTRMGEYDKKELEVIVDKPTITGDAISHYRRYADGEPGITFCVSVKHAAHVASAFCDAGYRAKMVEGGMDDKERKQAIDNLGAGRIHMLTSCDLVSEGMDVPVVSVIILLRHTKSEGLHRQQMGRGLRTAPGKKRALFLDHVGNCLRHGLPTTPREWTLDVTQMKQRLTKKQDREEQISYCPQCYHIFPKATVCPRCGATIFAGREIKEVEGELTKLDEVALQKARKFEVQRCRSLESLVSLAYQRGYAHPEGWARRIYEARGGKVVRRGVVG